MLEILRSPKKLTNKPKIKEEQENPREEPGNIFLSYGIHVNRPFPLAGKKVKDVKEILRSAVNADEDCDFLINGKEINEDYELQKNDLFEFVKLAGEKGVLQDEDVACPVKVK